MHDPHAPHTSPEGQHAPSLLQRSAGWRVALACAVLGGLWLALLASLSAAE